MLRNDMTLPFPSLNFMRACFEEALPRSRTPFEQEIRLKHNLQPLFGLV